MRALSIRQPFAELILQGIKTIEYRSRPTRIVGERFYIYASMGRGTTVLRHEGTQEREGGKAVWSEDLAGVEPEAVAPWMWELAEALRLWGPGEDLPRGVIVGSAVIEKVTPPGADEPDGLYRWHLADVKRAGRLRKPTGHPQPVWFKPFNAT